MVDTQQLVDPMREARRALRPRAAGRDGVIVDDVENIRQAFHAGVRIDQVLCTPSGRAAAADLETLGVPVLEVTSRQARELFGVDRAARVFAVAHPARPRRLGALRDAQGDLVVLDGVRLVGNIGAIVRTTVALGGSGVVLLDSGLTTVHDRRLIRASRGLVFRVPVVLSTAEALLAFCQDQGIRVVAGSARAGADVMTLSRVPGRMAMVLGGERHGCSTLVEEQAAGRVRIATTGRVESLNVSVAAGIMLNVRSRRNLACRGA